MECKKKKKETAIDDSNVVSNIGCAFHVSLCVTWLISLLFQYSLNSSNLPHLIAMLFLSCTFADRERYSDRGNRNERDW